jgi:hypothetical protein
MGTQSTTNETNKIEMGNQPTKSYRADIYNFDIETQNSIVYLTINNVISWEWLKMRLTREELKNFANFLNSYLDNI